MKPFVCGKCRKARKAGNPKKRTVLHCRWHPMHCIANTNISHALRCIEDVYYLSTSNPKVTLALEGALVHRISLVRPTPCQSLQGFVHHFPFSRNIIFPCSKMATPLWRAVMRSGPGGWVRMMDRQTSCCIYNV